MNIRLEERNMVMRNAAPKPKAVEPASVIVPKAAPASVVRTAAAPIRTTPRPAIQKVIAPATARPVAPPKAAPVTIVQPTCDSVRSAAATVAPRKNLLTTTKLLIGISVLVCIGILIFFVSFSRNRTAATTVAKGKAPVVAPGLVEPDSGLLKLSFELAGKLRSVKVVEGQAVVAGEVIAELENSDIAARLESSKAALRLSEAQVKTLEADLEAEIQQTEREAERCRAELALLKAGARPEEIARAKADVDAAQADSQRAADDFQKYNEASSIQSGAWSVQQRDNARRISEAAAARLKAIRETLGVLVSGARKEELQRCEALLAIADAGSRRAVQSRSSRMDAAKAQVATAQAHVKFAESELQKTFMRAPINGVVVWKYKHGGESVGILPPDPVVAVANASKLRVRADVDEADFGRVSVGQRVYVTADAFPGKKFPGRVTWLSDAAGQKRFSTGEARERMDVKVVETMIQLDEKCPLKLGLRVTAWFNDNTQTSTK